VAQLQAEVLVIGGGATGAGVAWDAALRGYDVVLVERGDLAEGTSGRFHGLLHSGGRYVVKDPVAAEECVVENAILRRVIPDCIEDTGGLFVTTPDDDPAYGDEFLEGCRKCALPVEEIDVAEALRREPRLNPGILRAFAVPDASIDAWKTVSSLTRGAAAHGARILTYHKVIGLHRSNDAVTGARVRNELTGEELDVEAGFTLNASGAWAAQILHMAGVEDVGVVPGKGIMIAMNHRLVNTVVNRCTMPADGDILVPVRTVSVIGTTDIRSADPDEIPVTQDEVDQMLDDGERLVPGFREARALRVWAGVRPLFQDAKTAAVTDTRDVSRTHAVVDHRERDGIDGLLTMSGGKLTTLRMMAQDIVDAMGSQLGDRRPCRTAEERPPGNEDGEHYRIGSRLARREATLRDEQLICECELVGRSRLEEAMRRRGTLKLDDIRRLLRLGMGPCQGGFCIYRATGIMHSVDRLDGAQAAATLQEFLQERWKGVWPILYGDQLRQARLDDWIFQGLLDVEHVA
jgi:glycerol-3-phosphate dehydrogenase